MPSSRAHHEPTNSAYFTATWGSPYEGRARAGFPLHTENPAIDVSSCAATPSTRALKTGHLLASGSAKAKQKSGLDRQSAVNQDEEDGTLASPTLDRRQQRYGFTKEWLSNNTWRKTKVVRRDRPSEVSISSDSIVSEAIEEDPKDLIQPIIPVVNPRNLSTVLDRAVSDTEQGDITAEKPLSMLASRPANPKMPSSIPQPEYEKEMDKPLPPPPNPFERTVSEMPIPDSATSDRASSPTLRRHRSQSSASLQRPRKKLLWRGKGCWISLPSEGTSRRDSQDTVPLTRDEVIGRLHSWEAKGYTTAGFQLCTDSNKNLDYGHSCAVFPDLQDLLRERSEQSFRVRIPSRAEWESYVERLKEEKLRALGVTSGDDDSSARNSPVPTFMSRHTSSQSSAFPISPSIGTHLMPGNSQQINGFEVPSLGTSYPGSRVGSVGPPGKPSVSHFPRYSMAMPSGGTQPPFPIPKSISPAPGISAPEFPYQHHPNSRGASPSIDTRMQSVGAAMKPGLPPHNGLQPQNQQARNLLAAVQAQQAQIQMQYLQQQQQQRHQLLMARQLSSESSKAPGRSGSHMQEIRSQPELATPIPRGHRSNLSETLHREAEQAEDRQKEMEIPREIGRNRIDDGGPTAANEVDDEIVESEPQSNSSRVVTPITDKGLDQTHSSRHRSTSSTSGLNAKAPEFNPIKAQTNNIFAFLDQQPQAPTAALDRAVSGSALTMKINLKSPSISRGLNVEAPAFIPSMSQKPAIPSREFSFSSSGPKYKPDAPTFKPRNSSVDLGRAKEKTIFSDIKFEEIIKPAKKSRAVPVLQQEDESSAFERDTDGVEDELGRITQPEGRQKRARRKDGDGDEVPLFAIPQDLDQGVLRCVSPNGVVSGHERYAPLLSPSQESMVKTNKPKQWPTFELTPLSTPTGDNAEQPFAFNTPEDAAMFSAANPRSPVLRSRRCSRLEGQESEQPTSSEAAGEPHLTGSSLRDVAGVSISTPAPIETNESNTLLEPPIEGVTYLEPSYNEIDAVMKHLNGDDSDVGVERNYSPVKTSTLSEPSMEAGTPVLSPPRPFSKRSGAPSPSPRRLQQQAPPDTPSSDSEANTADMETALVAENARFSPSYRPSMKDLAAEAFVHKLNSPKDAAISDWDDAISSSEELKFQTRTGFFARHVDDLVGNVVQERLDPLEKTLAGIQGYLATISSRSGSRKPQRSTSTGEIDLSDADDEDEGDDASQARPKSPLHSRKYDKLKAAVLEVSTVQQNAAPANQLAEVMSVVQELKKSIDDSPNSATNVKQVIEDAVARQMRGKSHPVTSSQQSASAEKSQLTIAGLESMLKVAEARAEDELKARRSTEDALADNQRLLRSAMHEAAEHREAAEETERSLEHLHEERHEMLRRNAVLEGSQESLERNVSTLTEKIEALEETLDEYRLSGSKWRGEIEETKADNNTLRKTIDALRIEMQESVIGRETIKSKFEQLQENMVATSRDIAKDQNAWRTKELEHEAKVERLGARFEAEARTRERLEREIERLESQEIESMKARFLVEETQKANADLEAQLSHFKGKCEEHLDQATSYARDLNEAQESSKAELARLRQAMEGHLDSAHSKARNVQAELESANSRLQAQLHHVSSESDASRARYESLLKDTTDRSRIILQEAIEAKNISTQEQISSYERAHRDLKVQHERDLSHTKEDKQRLESQFVDRLRLADEKNQHYTEKIAHLEEMLLIAQSAAQAAAQASRQHQQKSTSYDPSSPFASPASMSTNRGGASAIPEKISPQALRESILVLQEQLQERESRIEQLERSLLEFDTEAPKRVKEQDTEISWLRELLGVRLDDLQDIINILDTETEFDHIAVRDAAIRLRANLQMEQQEKERTVIGGLQGSLPASLSNITSLAASPRALPMAAAAAWGNWRKAKETSFGSLSAFANGSVHQTPQKPARYSQPSSSQSFLSGLLTPPNTSTSQTSSQNFSEGGVRHLGVPSSSQYQGPRTPRQSLSRKDNNVSPYSERNPPVTPTLMRNASYDQDAESTDMGAMSADTIAATGGEQEDGGLFGPSIVASARREE